MKIIYTLLFVLSLWGIISCRNADKPAQTGNTPEQLTKEQTEFINVWSTRFNPKHVPILSLFRNRHINKTDLKELSYYISHNDTTVDFDDARESLRIKTELAIDTLLTQNIQWINDEDVSICNKVDPDFWKCFGRRYAIEGFYYLTQPLFSADKKWCLMSVNYLSKQEGESFGGGRLYHLEKNKWEEKAFLSYWGKKPE